MPNPARMSAVVADEVPGSHREEAFRAAPSEPQTAFDWNAQTRVDADQRWLRETFREMVRLAGGVDWLTAALNRKPSYASKIVEAMNGAEGRALQLEWMAPLMRDPRALDYWMREEAKRYGYAPPVRERRVTPEQEAAAARDVLREMPEPLRTAYRQELARRLGVRVEDLEP